MRNGRRFDLLPGGPLPLHSQDAVGDQPWLADKTNCSCGSRRRSTLIILGIVLLVIGFITGIVILWTIGIIVLVIGLILALLGVVGREIGGRRHWY